MSGVLKPSAPMSAAEQRTSKALSNAALAVLAEQEWKVRHEAAAVDAKKRRDKLNAEDLR